MKTALLLVTLIAGNAADARDTCRESRYTEVLTSEDIVRSGAVRFSDLLALSDRWLAFSVDGYDWDAAPAGLGLPQHQRWRLFVDDKPLSAGLLGKTNLNLLPIHLFEVECIEIVSGPDVRGPLFSPFGAIRIYSKRPQREVTLQGGISAGNEVNDPGPFLYTDRSSPNIDRVGPIGMAALSASGQNASARLSGVLDEYHVTDEQIDLRAKQLYIEDAKPRINAKSYAVTARAETDFGSHSLLAGGSRTEDLLFFPSFGSEIPSTHRLEYAGASGSIASGPALLAYNASYLLHELIRRPNARAVAMDFGERRIIAGVSGNLDDELFGINLGGSVEAVNARSRQSLTDPTVLIARLHGGLRLDLFGRWNQYAFGHWTQADARPAGYGTYISTLQIDRSNALSLALSYGRHLTETESSLWLWTGRGFSLPEDSGAVADLPYEPAVRFFTADAEWRAHPIAELRSVARVYFRRFLGDVAPLYDLEFDVETTGLTGTTSFAGGVSGSIAGGGVTVNLTLVPQLRQRLTYNLERPVTSDANVRQSWDPVPTQRLAFTTIYSPVDRFSLFARLDYHSATNWPSYSRVDVKSGGRYPSEIRDFLLLDVAASKRLWKDHVLATLVLRNVLNEPIRYHPAGAIFNMTFHFAVQVYFNSEAGI